MIGIPGATYRHVRTGRIYRFIGYGTHTETEDPVAVYQGGPDGRIWVRPIDMFEDGRFERHGFSPSPDNGETV